MTKFIGRLADVGLAKESVRGTAVVPAFWIPKTNLTVDDKIQQVVDPSSVGVIEDSIEANVTEKFAEGTLEAHIRDAHFGLILLNALGAVSTTVDVPEAGVNTHEFTVGESAQHAALTISVEQENEDLSFPLAMINSLELNVMINEYARYTAGFRSKVGEAASLTPSYTEENIFLPQHGEFKVAANLAGLAGASAIAIRSVTLTIENNVEDDQNIGSLSPTDILNKQFAVSGTIELLYSDTTFTDLLTGDTAQAMRITLENTDVTIGAASSPKLEIDLAKVKFSEVTKPYPNDDLVIQTLSFKGHYSLSDSKLIVVTLINTTTSY